MCRRKQIQAFLADIKSNGHPLVLAGDPNTTGRNNTPTFVRNEVMSCVTDFAEHSVLYPFSLRLLIAPAHDLTLEYAS